MADFMYHAVPPRRQAWGRLLLAPCVAGYKLGLVSGVAVRRAVVRVGFAGVLRERVQAKGESFATASVPWG